MPAALRMVWTTVLATALWMTASSAQSSEELARRQYDNGMELLLARKYAEALRDFQAVLEAYPSSSVADNVLLELARYHLEVTRTYDQAQSAIDTLIKKYPTSDAAPFGYILDGQVALMRGRQPEDIDRALGSFQRVPRMFPESQAVAPALIARGDALRLTGRCAEAVEQYETVALSYPRSRWAYSASVGGSRCLVADGRPVDAMARLQEAVRSAPGQDLAAIARDLNTILYRLYIRPPQPAFVFVEQALTAPGRIRDLTALAVRGTTLIGASENGVTLYDLANDGRALRTDRVDGLRGVFATSDGRYGLYSSKAVQLEGHGLEPLSVLKADKTRRQIEDITAIAAVSTGELMVADANGPTVHRFGHDLKTSVAAFQARADRVAIGSLDQIATLDRAEKSVGLWTREGKPRGRLQAKGADWRFDSPVDVAFDAFDHLYVLDRGAGTVWVFAATQSPRLIAAFSIGERTPGAFRRATAVGIDGAGRLYVHDERAERIQVYQ